MAARGRQGRRQGEPTPSLMFFVLAAVRAGLDTAYALHMRAGLSVAAALPLLAKLKEDGLLESESGLRRSEHFHLTTRGKRILDRGWRRLKDTVPREFEAILRIAYVIAELDGSRQGVRDFLQRASAARQQLALEQNDLAKSIHTEGKGTSFGRGHRWLRAIADASRFRAEAEFLHQIATHKDLQRTLQSGPSR